MVNILLRLVRVVHWFNPIIWGLTGLIQTDNEALCDQRVLEYCSECNALAYGETLISMSEVKKRNPVRVGTSNMASSYRHMKTVLRSPDYISKIDDTLQMSSPAIHSPAPKYFSSPGLQTCPSSRTLHNAPAPRSNLHPAGPDVPCRPPS